jgi:hypothetical protein
VGDFSGFLNGLQFGLGTAYTTVGVTGWLDMAAAPLGGGGSVSPKATVNGSWYLPYFAPSRTVSIQLKILQTTSNFQPALDALSAATEPDAGAGPIAVTLQVGGVSTTAYGVVTARAIPTTLDYLAGYTTAQVDIFCFDPRRFGAALTSTLSLPMATGGLVVPFSVPVTLTTTQTTGVVTLTNAGKVAGPVTMRINGPISAPTITHQQSGSSLVFSSAAVVNAGDWLAIDCEAKTVLYNGQASRNGWLQTRGWFGFQPGANTIAFTTGGAYNSSAQLQVTATPAWL